MLDYLDEKNLSTLTDANLGVLRQNGYPPAILRGALNYLERREYIFEKTGKISQIGILPGLAQPDRQYVYWEIGPKGLDSWHSTRAQKRGGVEESVVEKNNEEIPASDRFVSLNHNAPEYTEAREAFDSLANAVDGANDLFADANEKMAVLSEIRFLKENIEKPSVRIAQFWQAINRPGILAWLAEQTSSAIVRDGAVKLVSEIAKIFGFFP